MTSKLDYVLTVNGERRHVTAPSSATLLGVLRDHLGLTGTKFNCEQGECGACTVLVEGRPVNSCLVLAATAAGADVTTVERAGDEVLTRVQRAFMACDASQCGYCTPGMILSAVALLRRDPNPDRRAIEDAIEGNYCRCTGYDSIVKAIEEASGPAGEAEGSGT